MRLICTSAFVLVFTLAIASGCASRRDGGTSAEVGRQEKVQAEFISMEVNEEDLEELGLEMTPDGDIRAVEQTVK